VGEVVQTVERRQLGRMLHSLRMRTDATQQDAAAVINRKQVRISQIENGRGALKSAELLALLDFYGATEEERATAISLGLETRRRQRRRSFTDDLPNAFQRFADLQANATEIQTYQYGLIPGPLQTSAHVESLIRLGNGLWWESAGTADDRIAFRLEQQRRVMAAEPAKKLRFVFTEEALHHAVGGPVVMRGQLTHLIELSERAPDLSIRVIPAGAPHNPALGGGFTVMDFESGPRVCFVSMLYGSGTYYDHLADTERLAVVFNRVSELAFTPEDTRALLVKILKAGGP
jgi:transcriptional regulator with XRE-family HTH domain